MIGACLSLLIRVELTSPGTQILANDSQLYNTIITAHAFLMIFFMVYVLILNSFRPMVSNRLPWYWIRGRYQLINYQEIKFNKNFLINNIYIIRKVFINSINNLFLRTEDDNLNNFYNIKIENNEIDNNNNKISFQYKKYVINNPYCNRKYIAKISKKEKGVYIFEIGKTKLVYIGSSINLYNRICSYFMPSILANADRRVLRYFRKYGFKDVKLLIYILPNYVTLKEVIQLEQHFINEYRTRYTLLNVDLVAGGIEGTHTAMSLEARNRLRRMKGTAFFVYDIYTHSLIFIFESKEQAYRNIHINHTTLTDCLYNGSKYLNRFLFSMDIISELPFISLISIEELKSLIMKKQLEHKSIQSKSVKIFAKNVINPKLSKEYNSINSFVKAVKGDRQTIRLYLEESHKNKLYRKQWKLNIISKNNM